MTLRIISFGGGRQTMAMLVLVASGELGAIDAAVFANVGDDSENPDTLSYLRDFAHPYAKAHGIALAITFTWKPWERIGTAQDALFADEPDRGCDEGACFV